MYWTVTAVLLDGQTVLAALMCHQVLLVSKSTTTLVNVTHIHCSIWHWTLCRNSSSRHCAVTMSWLWTLCHKCSSRHCAVTMSWLWTLCRNSSSRHCAVTMSWHPNSSLVLNHSSHVMCQWLHLTYSWGHWPLVSGHWPVVSRVARRPRWCGCWQCSLYTHTSIRMFCVKRRCRWLISKSSFSRQCVGRIHDTCSQLTWKSHSPHTHGGTFDLP